MRTLCLIFLAFFSSVLSAQDQKDIIVVTESWKGATNRDGSGLYWDIVEKVYQPLGYNIVKKHRSYNEAAQMVNNNAADFYLAAYKDEKSFAIYPKYHFDQDVVIAIYRTDVIEDWQGKDSLKGSKVGWVRGYDYDQYLNVPVNSEEFSNRNNGLKLLKSGRIDAFIDDKDDISAFLKKVKLDEDDFKSKIVLQLKLYPAFAKNKRGQKLSEIWDERMKELIVQDEFKEMYFNSEYALFPY